jgi:hypothetical protein
MKSLVSAFLAVSLLLASFAIGQTKQGRSAREGVMQSFERKSPAVGERLPDLKAFNAAGETIQLGELKGDYTVLVFGCLT